MAIVQPYFRSIACNNPLSRFSHFEIHACREYEDTGQERYTEVLAVPEDDADGEGGPVFYTVYGRYDPSKSDNRGVDALADRVSIASAHKWIEDINGPEAV